MTENNFQIETAAISDRGLSEKRPQNEDSFLELNKQGLFAVADGVGGAQAGDVASQMAVEILGEAFINLPKNGGDAEDLMRVAIERANEAIFQMSHDLAQLSTMATTIVALHIAGNIATIGHVGDSRLYRLDPKGNFFRETQDHSVVEEEVRAGRMTAEQALHHPSRNVISRALGAEHAVEVDMKTIMIEPNTRFLLCSDGITRHIDDFQLRELLIYKDTPANICDRMKQICYERGAEDNLTAVIVHVTDKPVIRIKEEKAKATPDLEESTVASARAPQIANEISAEQPVEEMPTQQLKMPVSDAAHSSNAAILKTDAEQKIIQHDIAVEKSSSSSGNVLAYLGLLLLGAILGAGAYYLLARNNQPSQVSQIAPVQTPTPDDALLTFERLRRTVDEEPETFIAKSVNMPPTAENSYLLGRAFLLTGKFSEAKKLFEESKNKLVQSSTVNSKVLATDIASGLAIIDETTAQNKFQSQIKPSNSSANTTVNANSSSVNR
jgi:serine/threonine protein phosphatase PrpC